VHADCLNGLFRRRKRIVEISEAFRRLRRCYPRKKLFVILDNLHNVHDHPRFLALLRRLRIAQFGILKRFTVAHTDDPSHLVPRRRIYRYLRYRHRKLDSLNHPLHRLRSISPIKLE